MHNNKHIWEACNVRLKKRNVIKNILVFTSSNFFQHRCYAKEVIDIVLHGKETIFSHVPQPFQRIWALCEWGRTYLVSALCNSRWGGIYHIGSELMIPCISLQCSVLWVGSKELGKYNRDQGVNMPPTIANYICFASYLELIMVGSHPQCWEHSEKKAIDLKHIYVSNMQHMSFFIVPHFV